MVRARISAPVALSRSAFDRFRSVFDAMADAACLLEPIPLEGGTLSNYRYAAMNQAMLDLFGIPDVTGSTIRDHFPDEVEDWYADYDRVMETGVRAKILRESEPQGMVLEMTISRLPDVPVLLVVMQDVTERVRAQQALGRSEERARALLEATSEVVFLMNADWSVMQVLSGARPGTLAGSPPGPWMDEYILPSDQPFIRERIAAALAEGVAFHLEHPIRRPDGTPGWAFTKAVPINGDDGAIAEWFGMSVDITPRRDAEERQLLLVRELDHRIKNNITLVQAIAVQTFGKIEGAKDALQHFTSRLLALAGANDIVTGKQGADVHLRGVIAKAVEPHCEGADRLVIGGPDFEIPARSAISLSLALHELATNATKYGAWSVPAGIVLVTWSSELIGDQRRLLLEWREVGGPPCAPPERRGFGTKLIEKSLAGGLEGKVSLAFEPTGLSCSIDARVLRLAKT